VNLKIGKSEILVKVPMEIRGFIRLILGVNMLTLVETYYARYNILKENDQIQNCCILLYGKFNFVSNFVADIGRNIIISKDCS
jgi:hypothetical protein